MSLDAAYTIRVDYMTPQPPNVSSEKFRDNLQGKLLEPGDAGYDEARTIWNALIDKYPRFIVKCAGVADVIASVNFARTRDLLVSIKGGGHHVSGNAVCDGGLMIDLSDMNAITVDPDELTAVVQAGATWGKVDQETQPFGLAAVGGQDPNIGVAGLTLGGGVGWLSRKYGLTIDNLIEVEMITAEGHSVRADSSKNTDLFWALRGGGGNFGVVTSFKYRLHKVENKILAGSLIYRFEDTYDVTRHYSKFAENAPNEVRILFGSMVLPQASYLPPEVHNKRVAIIIACHVGDPESGERVLAPLRSFGDPLVDSIKLRSYHAFQRAGTSEVSQRTYVRSQYVREFTDEIISSIFEFSNGTPGQGSTTYVSHRGGKETEPDVAATAYPHRSDAHHILIESRWEDPIKDEDHINWVRKYHESISPLTTGTTSINFMTDDIPKSAVRASFGPNFERLRKVKYRWDPDNVFRMNQNIEPAI